ncbi:hypothetical protein Tco_0045035 [Tanacetum coccineum]
MTKINDVEANLEQFKSETLALQKETSNRFDRMQESIDKNKEDADRQFAKLLEQGENDWQPHYEPNLQDIQDTPGWCNLKPHMDVTQEGRACLKLSYCSFGPVLKCDNVLHLVVV